MHLIREGRVIPGLVVLPWHRRSSYEPDAPARGVPHSPRWRVGLVCAKDAKLSCRGNRLSTGAAAVESEPVLARLGRQVGERGIDLGLARLAGFLTVNTLGDQPLGLAFPPCPKAGCGKSARPV